MSAVTTNANAPPFAVRDQQPSRYRPQRHHDAQYVA
jgi:hypothetical protein